MEARAEHDDRKKDESGLIRETEELNTCFADLLLDVHSPSDFQSVEEEKQAVNILGKEKDETMKDKLNKKKKKSKLSGPSPNRIMMFNAAEEKKLQEMKLKNQNSSHERKFLKFLSFPAPVSSLSEISTPENFNGGKLQAETSGEALASELCTCPSPDMKSSLLMRCNSLPVKSALRGGCKELGLGPRPKLGVRWAPDVYDPAQTSVSHTVNHNYHSHHHKKEGHKKGKSSHTDTRKKHDKKHSHKSRCSSSKLRMQAVYPHVGHKGELFLAETDPICMLLPTDSDIEVALSPLTIPENVSSHSLPGWDFSSSVVAGEAGSDESFVMKSDRQSITCSKGASKTESSPFHSKCFGSFHALRCKLLYGEAI